MSGFDWAAARARTEALSRALESGGAPSPEEAGRILRERARALARRLDEPAGSAGALDLLLFSRSGDGFGVDVAKVLEALPAIVPTRLPGSRPGIAGVALHRARLIAVVDLGGLRHPGSVVGGPGGGIVVVEALGATFGLLADAISGVLRVAAEEVAPATSGSESWVLGTTAELVSVLDLESLVQDPRIRVEE
jgi:chemotaxis signal transduction protein